MQVEGVNLGKKIGNLIYPRGYNSSVTEEFIIQMSSGVFAGTSEGMKVLANGLSKAFIIHNNSEVGVSRRMFVYCYC